MTFHVKNDVLCDQQGLVVVLIVQFFEDITEILVLFNQGLDLFNIAG